MQKSIQNSIKTVESLQKEKSNKKFTVYEGERIFKFKKVNLTEIEFKKLLTNVLNDTVVELNNDQDMYEISGIILKRRKKN